VCRWALWGGVSEVGELGKKDEQMCADCAGPVLISFALATLPKQRSIPDEMAIADRIMETYRGRLGARVTHLQ
jgi:hypothetical protein